MKTFTNLDEVYKYLESYIPINLEKIGVEVKGILRRYLLTNWYQAYTPQYYTRTNMLIDSITVSKVKKVGNVYEVEIYFDPDKIVPMEATIVGNFPSHMNVTDYESDFGGLSYGELLPLWVEKGQHSKIHSYLGIFMVQDTIDWVKTDHYLKNRMKEILEGQGFKCM